MSGCTDREVMVLMEEVGWVRVRVGEQKLIDQCGWVGYGGCKYCCGWFRGRLGLRPKNIAFK